MDEKPEFKPVVSEKLDELHHRWEILDSTTKDKAHRLFQANRSELFSQGCEDLNKWMDELESQLHAENFGKDLTSVNILLKKLQVIILLILLTVSLSTKVVPNVLSTIVSCL